MPAKPLAIDLFCGLGGWTEGLLAEGYRVVGFDIERHRYPARDFNVGTGRKVAREGVDFNSPSKDSRDRSFNYANECALKDAPLTGGWAEYPAQLVLQDVLTIHGSQFKDAALIVASPPCQSYSYRAMPWKRAKALPPPDKTLFEACFRIQREACEAAGRHIPLVVENVRGAQKWVGRARWHYGSFYLWGDVPALMPMTRKWVNVPTMGAGWYPPGHQKHRPGLAFNGHAERNLKATKNNGGFAIAHNTTSGHSRNPVNTIANAALGRKQKGSGAAWWRGEIGMMPSNSSRRKAASAQIAKIPYELAQHIARAWKPLENIA